MPTLVRIDDLSKRFGPVRAVDGVSFSVDRGEVLGFLGPNGAGKSTTMKMITGFLAPDAGSVTVAGERLAARPLAVKRRLGYLPEGAPLYGDMTPRAFLDFIAAVRGFRGTERRRRVHGAVDRLQLAEVVEQPIETLSKGFKRRLGLAQAILHDPEVLVLDEPTDGLDPNQKHEVRALIREMAPEKAIILSTHILEEVDAVCTRAVIITRGRIVSDGTPEALRARAPSRNAVTIALREPVADGVRERLGEIPGVAAVETLEVRDGLLRLRVRPRDGRALVAEVSEAARRHGWSIEELGVDPGRLDDVFREVTATAPGTAAAAGD